MPEPLKNLYTKKLLVALSKQIQTEYKDFDANGFVKHVMDKRWEQKELKERMRHVTKSLHQFLPLKYPRAIKIFRKISPKFTGFEYMFFPEFVELYGLDEFDLSVSALEHFTENASSEFAVRPFIKKYNSKMMDKMLSWAESENHHVRRLASEGCRPRLPWAMALPEFKKDPQPVIQVLEKLKNDDSEYVRRSVANNLNDISKDNPDLVVGIAGSWLGVNSTTDTLVKHACRSLLKQGHPEVLKLFGFKAPKYVSIKKFKVQNEVKIGNVLDFSFSIKSEGSALGKIRLEYVIEYLKKNGEYSRKVFKISESINEDNSKLVQKSHSFKIITTRKYYPGTHGLGIIVNGKELAHKKFKLS